MRVLADPADARNAGETSFQHGAGIHKSASLDNAVMRGADEREQKSQFIFDQLVIVISPGIAGNPTLRLTGALRTNMGRKIVHGNRNDGDGPRHQLQWISPQLLAARQIIHLAREPPAQPVGEGLLARRDIRR